MTEGGVYPWKRRSTLAAAAPDYQRLLKPLPDPPTGLSWVHDAASPQKWILVAHTDVAAQHEEQASCLTVNHPASATVEEDEWTLATATRVVPLETQGLLSPRPTTEESSTTVFAQATVPPNEASSGERKNDHAGYVGCC